MFIAFYIQLNQVEKLINESVNRRTIAKDEDDSTRDQWKYKIKRNKDIKISISNGFFSF